MEITLNVPDYNQTGGLRDQWQDGHEITVAVENREVSIFANREGLISLATHLLALSQINVRSGYHLHFSRDYGLDAESVDLILGKK